MPPVNILIADDYDDNRELLRLVLETAGYGVCETHDGDECLAAARAETFDLVLVDLSMPRLDGWDVLRALRADERTRDVPCVAITAAVAERAHDAALAAGFDAYIAKPYRAQELLAVIARLLQGRAAHDDTRAASS